jgi:hypothetical protein
VRGLDAFQVLFADSRRWLREGWLDYMTPQLYWAISAPQQSYPQLLEWWATENVRGRHLWPGNGTYKVTDRGSVQWPAREIVQQIQVTRDQPGSGGNVHYNMGALVRDTDRLASALATGPYGLPALVPASHWLSARNPVAPLVTRSEGSSVTTLRVTPAGAADGDQRWWLVRARYPDGWRAKLVPAAAQMVRLPADRTGRTPDLIAVSAIDRAGVESLPSVSAGDPSAPSSGTAPPLRHR